ncbi:MAG: hypothetical protein ACRCYO_14885 [Bacteroidia bacterium]
MEKSIVNKIKLFLILTILVLLGWFVYFILFSRTSRSVLESVSGFELDNTYNIQTIQDDWAEPMSMRSDGVVFLKVNLTETQCTDLINQASKRNYQPLPIKQLESFAGIPTAIKNATTGVFLMNIGVPDNRDITLAIIDTTSKKMYIYICYM